MPEKARGSTDGCRDALADLSAAATAFLRAEPDGLSRLLAARDHAETLLGPRPEQRAVCTCRASATGFHAAECAIVEVLDAA